jgi:hypothetical protein
MIIIMMKMMIMIEIISLINSKDISKIQIINKEKNIKNRMIIIKIINKLMVVSSFKMD